MDTPKNEATASIKIDDKFKTFIQEAKDNRIKVEATWMEIDSMMDGNHYIYYDKMNRTIQQVPVTRKGTVRRTINKMRAQEKTLTNLINKNEPAFNITPLISPESTPKEIQNAKNDAQVIQYKFAELYNEKHFKHKFKQAVRVGARYGVAIGQVCWDDEEDEADIKIYSPWDVYIDPTCGGNICDARYIIKAIPVDLETIKNNPRYKNTEHIVVEGDKQAESEFRNQFLQFKYPSVGNKNRAIMFECWMKDSKKTYKEEDESGTPEVEKKIKIVSWIGDVPIREEYLNDDEYPFDLYYPNEVMGEMYPRPIFADIISLNKSLDAVYSFWEEYIATVGVGRYIKHDSVELNTQSTGAHGQIMTYTGPIGRQPVAMDMPPLPQAVYGLKDAIERAMDDITGVQSLNMDAVARSGASGALIGQLQAQQSANLGEPTENLELFATKLYEIILDLMDSNYSESKIVQSPDKENMKAYRIRGSKALSDISQPQDGETLVSKDKYSVKISIIPGSAFSDIQKKQDIIELFDRKAVDRQTLLEAYSLGNTREILERLEKEEEAKMAAEAEQKASMGSVDNKLAQEKQMQEQMMQMGMNPQGVQQPQQEQMM